MAASLVLISSMATRHALAELLGAWRRESGQAATLQAMGGVQAAAAVRAGAAADLALLAAGPMAGLEAEGHLRAGSLTRFARSSMALALPESDATPAPDTVAALQDILRRAGSVGYSTGPSGDHLVALWRQWGFDRDRALTLTQAPAGVPVARLIAEGAVKAGVQQLSELQGQPGVRVAGPLPEGAQLATDFVVGLASNSADPERADALRLWLSSPAHAPVLLRHGFA